MTILSSVSLPATIPSEAAQPNVTPRGAHFPDALLGDLFERLVPPGGDGGAFSAAVRAALPDHLDGHAARDLHAASDRAAQTLPARDWPDRDALQEHLAGALDAALQAHLTAWRPGLHADVLRRLAMGCTLEQAMITLPLDAQNELLTDLART